MTLAETLAGFIVKAEAGAIPARAAAGAKAAIGDCIACILAGAATDTAGIVRDVIRANGGRPAATLLGQAVRASVPDAALANGVAGHALDYDDINWSMYGHPSVAVLPAALAVAESRGRSGRDLLAAYVVGVEVAAKLSRWANPRHYEHGWHATATLGTLGATAAAARLLDLPEDRTAMALGIGASEAGGVRRNFGSMTKPFHAGNAARAGVLAAQLAAGGFTADVRSLEGPFGFFDTLNGRETPEASALSVSLGRPYDVEEPGIVLKRYPACGCTHCALDALLELRQAHGFGAAEVVAVECAIHPLALKVLQHSRPRTGLEGKFSMEFCLAVALIEGHPRLQHFTDGWTRAPRVRELLPKLAMRPRPDLAETPSADAVPAEVTVRLADGRCVSRRVSVPRGDPRKPMSAEERRAKFDECAALGRLGSAAAEVWSRLEALETLDSVAALAALLRGPAGR